MTNEKAPAGDHLSAGMILLMAFACGAMAANLYYAQTLIDEIGPETADPDETAATDRTGDDPAEADDPENADSRDETDAPRPEPIDQHRRRSGSGHVGGSSRRPPGAIAPPATNGPPSPLAQKPRSSRKRIGLIVKAS